MVKEKLPSVRSTVWNVLTYEQRGSAPEAPVTPKPSLISELGLDSPVMVAESADGAPGAMRWVVVGVRQPEGDRTGATTDLEHLKNLCMCMHECVYICDSRLQALHAENRSRCDPQPGKFRKVRCLLGARLSVPSFKV